MDGINEEALLQQVPSLKSTVADFVGYCKRDMIGMLSLAHTPRFSHRTQLEPPYPAKMMSSSLLWNRLQHPLCSEQSCLYFLISFFVRILPAAFFLFFINMLRQPLQRSAIHHLQSLGQKWRVTLLLSSKLTTFVPAYSAATLLV